MEVGGGLDCVRPSREREHGVQLRGSRKMYGSVERVEGEGEEDTSRRFRVESHSPTHQVSPRSALTILDTHTDHDLGLGQKLLMMSLNNHHGKNNVLCVNLLRMSLEVIMSEFRLVLIAL